MLIGNKGVDTVGTRSERLPEHELEAVLFGVWIPMRPVPVASIIEFVFNLACWDTKGDRLVRLRSDLSAKQKKRHVSYKRSSKHSSGTYNEILIRLVWRLSLLFPGAHEPPARNDARLDLRQVDLHHHALLARLAVAHFRHAIPRPPDLQEHLALHARLLRGDL
jgi:hypothetical protein